MDSKTSGWKYDKEWNIYDVNILPNILINKKEETCSFILKKPGKLHFNQRTKVSISLVMMWEKQGTISLIVLSRTHSIKCHHEEALDRCYVYAEGHSTTYLTFQSPKSQRKAKGLFQTERDKRGVATKYNTWRRTESWTHSRHCWTNDNNSKGVWESDGRNVSVLVS